MTTSVIINSAALGPKSGAVLSSVGQPYSKRIDLLDGMLVELPSRAGVDEVIVVGEYKDGPGYRYISAPSRAFDCTDALHQRQAGFEASSGDLLVFAHDDHKPDIGFFNVLRQRYVGDDSWDVLVPVRRALEQGEILTLNNGFGVYVMGHACVMRRAMATAVPWSSVQKIFTWDVDHTARLRAAGTRIKWVEDLIVWDLEERAPGFGW